MSAGARGERSDSANCLLLDDGEGGLTLRKATLAERLLSRVFAQSLDEQLARGASPDGDALLALRARFLMRLGTRRVLARSLARVLSDAEAPSSYPSGARVSVARRNVLDAADGLTALIDALTRPTPPSARGVAAVELLLVDGTGPVYNPNSTERLPRLVEEALLAMAAVD